MEPEPSAGTANSNQDAIAATWSPGPLWTLLPGPPVPSDGHHLCHAGRTSAPAQPQVPAQSRQPSDGAEPGGPRHVGKRRLLQFPGGDWESQTGRHTLFYFKKSLWATVWSINKQ